MFEMTALDIHGYQHARVPNLFYHQQRETDHLAIVFPGMGYTAQMPVLYYPARLLVDRGADVLRVDYAYHNVMFPSLVAAGQNPRLQDDVMAAYRVGTSQRRYERVTLVGKSLGTLALGYLLANAQLPPVRCIWLTPLLLDDQLRSQISQLKSAGFLAIGTADPFYDTDRLAEVVATGCRTLVIEGADHSLEIQGNLVESIRVQAQIIEALEQFIG